MIRIGKFYFNILKFKSVMLSTELNSKLLMISRLRQKNVADRSTVWLLVKSAWS